MTLTAMHFYFIDMLHGKARSRAYIKHVTTISHVAQNELDTHMDTCCAGANWALLELTGDVCEVTPLLDMYQLINKIPLARCGTVWTDPTTMHPGVLTCWRS